MSEEKVRVLIVDDHDLARAGLRGLVEDEPDLVVIAEAKSGIEALAFYKQHQPDLVLMDIRMPGFDGIKTTEALCRTEPDARVLVVSSYDTEEEVFRAHEAGARGYLLKESRGKEIVEAIRKVASGGRHMPPAIAARLENRALAPSLSAREKQVLELLYRGNANRDIAETLGLSAGTVRMYVSQVLEKLGAENRTAAVKIGLERGIIRPDDRAPG